MKHLSENDKKDILDLIEEIDKWSVDRYNDCEKPDFEVTGDFEQLIIFIMDKFGFMPEVNWVEISSF